MRKNHYNTLGIEKTATDSEIKTAFKKAAKKHHPDKGGDRELFEQVVQARDTLMDPSERILYDRRLNHPPAANETSYTHTETHTSTTTPNIDRLSKALHPFSEKFSSGLRTAKDPYTFKDAFDLDIDKMWPFDEEYAPAVSSFKSLAREPNLKIFIGGFAGFETLTTLPNTLPLAVDIAFPILVGSTTALAAGYIMPFIADKIIPAITTASECLVGSLSKSFWAASNTIPNFSHRLYKAAFTASVSAATFFMPDATYKILNFESSLSAQGKNPLANTFEFIDLFAGVGKVQTISVGAITALSSCVTGAGVALAAIAETQDLANEFFSSIHNIDIANDSFLWEAGSRAFQQAQPIIEQLVP